MQRSSRRIRIFVPAALVAALLFALQAISACRGAAWSAEERAAIASLALQNLPPPPADPSNAWADDSAAAEWGRALFFDARLSAGGQTSCASCHQPALHFTDGRPLAQGEADFTRHTPTLVGVAWSPWSTWDGKADGLWSQALLPLENAAEQGLDRTALAHTIADAHAAQYAAIFGPLPPLNDGARFPPHAGPLGDEATRAAWAAMAPADQEAVNRVFANTGKALAAFQRTLAPQSTRFDLWAAALAAGERPPAEASLTRDEQAGLRLFIGEAQCLNCHNGPLFTNNTFHNTGVPPAPGLPLEHGRAATLAALADAPFSCLSAYSDVKPEDAEACAHLRFAPTDTAAFEGAFRTPTLRSVAQTAPYMHTGQFANLAQVLEFYNQGGAPPLLGHNELANLNLTPTQLAQIEVFLGTLTPSAQP